MNATAAQVFAHLVDWQTHLRLHDPDEDARYGLSATVSMIVTDWANTHGDHDPAAARLVRLAVHGASEVAEHIRAAARDGVPVALAGRFLDFTLFPAAHTAAGQWALQLTEDTTTPGPSHAAAVCQAITCALNDDSPAAHDVMVALHRTGGVSALTDVLVDLAQLVASLTVPEGAR